MLPLDNIKVLDLTTRAPGPFCTMTLSDLGAEVLQVEAPPGTGSMGSPDESVDQVREAAFNALRRNKRSIVLNLKDDAARQILYDLVKDADVFMEQFRPGTVERLGVDYESLKRLNPRIVYCSISGYGQNGPYRLLPGHDINYISFAGVLGMMGSEDGQPAIPSNLIADFAGGGYLGAVSILSALWARERLGQGQYVDLSMTDGAMYLTAQAMGQYLGGGPAPRPSKERLNGGFPDYYAYKCRDGKYLSVGALEQKFWNSFCQALGRRDMIERRGTDPDGVLAELKEIFLEQDRDEWFELLAQSDTAVGKVYSLDELADDPQVKAREMVVEVPGPGGKSYPQIGVGPKLAETPGKARTAGVPPGANTREVLRELGLSEKTIDDLHGSRAVSSSPEP